MSSAIRSRLAPLVALAVALAALLAPASAQAQRAARTQAAGGVLTVDVLDVGQGDAILIRSPEGKTALIDAGPTREAAAEWLRNKGVESVDLVVVTHHHLDHHGGMESVIRDWKPRYFLATDSDHTTQSWLRLLKTVKAEGITTVLPTSKARRVELGSVTLTILPQPPHDPKDENDNSIGIRLQYGGFSMLMTGDSEPPSRKWWLENCPELLRDCSVLKLAHHGSHNGTDSAWLDVVRPELAVASLAAGNSYGHPHSQTLELLKAHRVPLVRTDQWGTITMVSDGESWNLVSSAMAKRGGKSRARGEAVAAGDSGRTRRR